MKIKIIVAATLAGIAALGAVLGPQDANASKAEPAAKPLSISVQALVVQPTSYTPKLRASAMLVGRDEANIGAEIAGVRVERVLAEEGDTVKAGQVLALLDGAQLGLGSEQAQSQLDQARLDAQSQKEALARQERGLASGSLSVDAVEKSRFGLKAAQARERSASAAAREAKLRLSKTTIKAPFDAMVVERKARAGSTVSQPGEILFILQPQDSLEVQADFSEKDASALRVGQPATISADGQTFEGRVRRPAARVGEGRVASARIAFVQQPTGLRSGMSASVEVSSPERRSIRVPEAAIAFEGASAYAIRIQQGKARRAPLRLGLREGGLIEALDGLSPGDVIVSSGPSFVREGDVVSPLLPAKEPK
jgi:HlyD family secretion protein